jgi:hypothetical protein
MSLPFLKDKEGSVSMPNEAKLRKPDGEEHDDMHLVAQELIAAIHSKNIKDVAELLKTAFILCDAEPHHEGKHI